LLTIAPIAILNSGKFTWTQRIADTFRSNAAVLAQSTTRSKTFSEDISLQFFIDQNYVTTVEGVIELVNISGKDISLTQYDMDLPYFTLKNTKIGYIYPKAFLVDMYSRNNSILFTFKSQYTKPVVIGKNARITFTFSAKVEKPFYELGDLKVLIFPYSLAEEGRDVRITVSVNKELPVVSAPQVAKTLRDKGIYTISNEAGKVIIFATEKNTLSTLFSHTAEVPLPSFSGVTNCTSRFPVSCIGCGNIVKNGDHGEMAAQRAKNAKTVVFHVATQIQTACAINKFKQVTAPQTAGKSFRAGFVISPISNQLIPATWRVHEGDDGTYATSFLARGVPYFYADPFGYLSIPLYTCTSDDDCRAKADALQNIETSISSTTPDFAAITVETDKIVIQISQQQRQFYAHIQNQSDTFVSLDSISLSENAYFTLPETYIRLIAPKTSIELPLQSKSVIQSSNRDVTLAFMLNGNEKLARFRPLTITLLAIIELLAYLFIASVGITLLSMLGIIIYTRYYEKRKNETTL